MDEKGPDPGDLVGGIEDRNPGSQREEEPLPRKPVVPVEDEKPLYAVYGVHAYPTPPRDLQQMQAWMQRALNAQTFQPQAKPMGYLAFRVTGETLAEYRQHQQKIEAGETDEAFTLFRPKACYHQSFEAPDGAGGRVKAPLCMTFFRLEEQEPTWVQRTKIGLQGDSGMAGSIQILGDSRTRGSWTGVLEGQRVAFGPLQYDGDTNWTLATRSEAVGFMRTVFRAIEDIFRNW